MCSSHNAKMSAKITLIVCVVVVVAFFSALVLALGISKHSTQYSAIFFCVALPLRWTIDRCRQHFAPRFTLSLSFFTFLSINSYHFIGFRWFSVSVPTWWWPLITLTEACCLKEMDTSFKQETKKTSMQQSVAARILEKNNIIYFNLTLNSGCLNFAFAPINKFHTWLR